LRFRFIQAHQQEFPVNLMCHVLQVSRSGYYAWRRRAPSATAERQTQLTEQIRQVHKRSRAVYGSPRVHRDLLAEDVRCSQNTVAKLMRAAGLRSKRRQRFRVRTTDSRHGHPIAPNRLNRAFCQPQPDQAWAADITYIATAEGWLYLAVIIDLCSRKIVGWATSDSLAAELCVRALEAAVRQRRPRQAVLHHSDRGVQYACDDYQGLLARHGLQPSMSRRGNCYDNAVTESFFGTLKTELVHHERYATREAARQSLFEYIEVFYNRSRRHSALGYVSPAAYEQQQEIGAHARRRRQADTLHQRSSVPKLRDRARPGKGLAGRQPSNPKPNPRSQG
jgi:transposase InsO family protein